MSVVMLWLMACAPQGPGELLLSPGTSGEYGAARIETTVQARVTEALDVTVTFPADDDGWPAAAALPAPAVVLVQGGLVEPDRYQWLASHLAAQGYAVLAPEHPGDLAIFAAENGRYALDGVAKRGGVLEGLIEADAPAGVGGHSLGGVVSAMLWTEDDRFEALFLLASYPADGTDVESRSAPVLSLTGELDAQALVEQVESGWQRFSEPRYLGVVEGMGHYGWTDDSSAEDLAQGGDDEPEARSSDLTRADALPPLVAFLEATLRDDVAAEAALEAGDFAGVTWSP